MTAPADNTPAAIIEDAMRDAGLLQEGQRPNSEQLAKYSRRLRDLIKVEQTQGIKLWLQTDIPVTLVVGTATYTMSPTGNVSMVKPLQVVDAYFSDSSQNRRPIFAISRQEYDMLSQVTQQGQVTQYFVDKQQSALVIKLWLVPDSVAATGTVHFVVRSSVTSFTSLTETMNFPDEWRMFLHWGLAAEICTGQPVSIVERCEMKAAQYRTMLEDWDVEDADTRFEPELRGGNSGAFI